MTEDDARNWFTDRFGREACDRTAEFLNLVVAENGSQNLISPASIATIWVRHAVDSAQLLTLAPDDWRIWLDVGTGGGFPGMVVGLLAPARPVVLVEPRRRRAEFLAAAAQRLGLNEVSVSCARIEAVRATADVISARAVSSIEKLLHGAAHCATARTTWLLPRGRTGREELARAGPVFHVEQSLTDPESVIGILQGKRA